MSGGPQRVVVDPYVALAIVDHHQRRPEKPENADPTKYLDRVSGYVMGSTIRGCVEVRNFVPSFDGAFVDLVLKASTQDLAVGWYATSVSLPNDMEQHQTVAKNVDFPIFLTVTCPTDDDEGVVDKTVADANLFRFRAFLAERVSLNLQSDFSCFKEIPCVVQPLSDASNLACDTLVNQLFNAGAASARPNGSTDPLAELKTIRQNLEIARKYVDDVASGKRQGDKATGRALTQMLAMATRREQQDPESNAVEEKMQDALMLQYIAKVLQQQLRQLDRNCSKATKD